MRSHLVPAESLDQVRCGTGRGVGLQAQRMREAPQKLLGRAEAATQLPHIEIAIALGQAPSVRRHQQRNVCILGMPIAEHVMKALDDVAAEEIQEETIELPETEQSVLCRKKSAKPYSCTISRE